MAVQNLGRVGIVLKGAWNSATNYVALDLVSYDGNSWVAKRNNTNVTPNTTNSDDWQLISNNADLVATVQGYKNDAADSASAAAASATAAASSASKGTEAQAMIAPTEASTTASVAHIPGTASEYFILSGTLYQAMENIASGGTIVTSGTGANCQAVPEGLGGEVGELKSAITNDVVPSYSLLEATIENKRINASGVVVNNNGCYSTDYIVCKPGFTVKAYAESYYYQNDPAMSVISFYGADKAFISSVTQIDGSSATTSQVGYFTATAPQNTAYVRYCYRGSGDYWCRLYNVNDWVLKNINDGTLENLQTTLDFYACQPVTFHVNASAVHSSTADQLAIDIPSGGKFAILYFRHYANNIQFNAFDASQNATSLGTYSSKYGIIPKTAAAAYKAIGLTVTSNSSADDYAFAVVQEGQALFTIIQNLIDLGGEVSDLKSQISEVLTETATPITYSGKSSIDTDGKIISVSSSAAQDYRVYCVPVVSGFTYTVAHNDTQNRLICAFYQQTALPAVGDTSYNGQRIDQTDSNVVTAPVTGWLAFRSVTTQTDEGASYRTAIDAVARGDCSDLQTQLDAAVTTIVDDWLKRLSNTPIRFHVNANTAHSSLYNRVDVNITSGSDFAIIFTRHYTNRVQFYGFDASDNSTLLFGSTNQCGYVLVTATDDLAKIGMTVEANVSADDYTFAIVERDQLDYLLYDQLAQINSEITNISPLNYDWATKCALYSALYQSCGKADGFVYFTDPHLLEHSTQEEQNTEAFLDKFNRYTSIIKGFSDRTSAEFVLCGGDWLEWTDTPATALYKLNMMTGRMKELFPGYYYPVFGNHDNNYQGTEVDGEKTLSQNTINAVMFPYQGNAYYSFKMTNAMGYVLDTGTDSSPGMTTYRWEQVSWLASKLLEDDSDHSAIFCHIVWNAPQSTEITPMMGNVQQLIGAYNAHTTITLNGITYDFSGCTGKVGYILGGHLHSNKSDLTNYSVPIIVRTTVKASSTSCSLDLVLTDWTSGKLYFVAIGVAAASTAEVYDI